MSETNGFVGNAKHPPVGTADDVFPSPTTFEPIQLESTNVEKGSCGNQSRRPPVMPIIVSLYLPLN